MWFWKSHYTWFAESNSCTGDSGGPLIRKTTIGGQERFEWIGKQCNGPNKPCFKHESYERFLRNTRCNTKKGPKKDIENYRPISNLCSTSKIFEELILKRILEIQETNNVDITGKNQHGFKKNRSTLTLGIQLQSLIARALDESNYALMASLDLSAVTFGDSG